MLKGRMLYERCNSSNIDVDSDLLFICILLSSDSEDIKNKESRRFIKSKLGIMEY